MQQTSSLVKQDDIKLLVPFEKPFSTEQIKNIKYLIDERQIDTKEAVEIVRSDEEWNNYLVQSQQGSKLKNITLIDNVRKKIAEKVELGFMEAAQKGGILLAILMDKTYGANSERNGPMFNVNGKNVGIKVNFDFQPYKKK